MKKTLLTTLAIGLLAGSTAVNAASYTETDTFNQWITGTLIPPAQGSLSGDFNLPIDSATETITSAMVTVTGKGTGGTFSPGSHGVPASFFNATTTFSVLGDISSSGDLNYSIASYFYLVKNVKIVVETSPREQTTDPVPETNNVPDSGASVGLLGLGLIGLGALRRRLS